MHHRINKLKLFAAAINHQLIEIKNGVDFDVFKLNIVTALLASMNPKKVTREKLKKLTDLPNIGKAGENDLNLLGIYQPEQLVGKCPYEMYYSLCFETNESHDPCVIDVFISITRFMNGENPLPWWEYTQERKNYLNKGN